MIPALGAVVLLKLPVAGGAVVRPRPAVVVGILSGAFQSVLVCGVSTAQLDDITTDWDEVFDPVDSDFEATSLRVRCAARLSFLFSVTPDEVEVAVGSVTPERLTRMRSRLAAHLAAQPGEPT